MIRRLLISAALAVGAAQAADYARLVENKVAEVDKVAAQGPYAASWPSLETYKVPSWYEDAKFGIFIHWGVYSVPAFDSEWYPRNMYILNSPVYKHQVALYGPETKFGYKDFIPKFTGAQFNAAQWAALFRRAGARYVVPVAEHHDGFPMYDCSFTDWSAAKMGPRRDILGELAAAIRKEGMHFGASSHRAEHWWFYNGGRKFPSDVQDPRYQSFYGPAAPDKTQPSRAYLHDWLARTSEIVDKYHPEIVWFDWWIEQPVFQPYLKKFAAFYYNRGKQWGQEVAINYKNKAFPDRAAVLDIERGKLNATRKLFWQTDTSISIKSWGYINNDQYRDPGSLIAELIDIVSKNGALLLNVGPKSDGTIPEQAQQILLAMGRWLAVNGEAIYGTRPYLVYGEGPTPVMGGAFKDTASKPFTSQDIRFTTRGRTLYAILLGWPADHKVVLHTLSAKGAGNGRSINNIELLGSKSKLTWHRTLDGVVVSLPPKKPCDYAYVLKLT
jgi:alpha-L-fucosidase